MAEQQNNWIKYLKSFLFDVVVVSAAKKASSILMDLFVAKPVKKAVSGKEPEPADQHLFNEAMARLLIKNAEAEKKIRKFVLERLKTPFEQTEFETHVAMTGPKPYNNKTDGAVKFLEYLATLENDDVRYQYLERTRYIGQEAETPMETATAELAHITELIHDKNESLKLDREQRLAISKYRYGRSGFEKSWRHVLGWPLSDEQLENR